jgi:hypothetical protein
LLLVAGLPSCARTTLRAFDGWEIQGTPTEPVEGRFRHPQTGHLLAPAEGLILAVDRYDPGSVFAIDDERCDTVLIEIPAPESDDLPRVIEGPRAYLRKMGCAWWHVQEEEAIEGRVEILEKGPWEVRARVDLRFAGRRVRQSGVFALSRPGSDLQPPMTSNGAQP